MSVHDMHRVTTGYLFKVTISNEHISSNGSHLSGWFLGPYKVSKVVNGLFYILCSLLNVLAHHLWVQFLKSTLLKKRADMIEMVSMAVKGCKLLKMALNGLSSL